MKATYGHTCFKDKTGLLPPAKAIQKFFGLSCFVNLETYPWLHYGKLSLLETHTGGCEMAAVEAEGFTIKAGMKNSKV